MNDLPNANAIREDGRNLVELPDGIDLDLGPLRVRQLGRGIVLEPLDAPQGIPPGTYTFETLPPLSQGAKAIIASIDAVAPFVDIAEGAKSHEEAPGITLEDEGLEGVDLSDEGLPGLDPDD